MIRVIEVGRIAGSPVVAECTSVLVKATLRVRWRRVDPLMLASPHWNDCSALVFSGGDPAACDAQRWRLAIVASLVLLVDYKTGWSRGGTGYRGILLTGVL